MEARIRLMCGALGLFLCLEADAQAPIVTRGPYLQSATSTRIVVRWRTNVGTDSRLRYGTALANLDQVVDDGVFTREHIVTLNRLLPDTRYFYSVGTTTATLAGGDTNHWFVTPPQPGTARPTRVWVVGDSGKANANAASVRDAYLTFAGANTANLWLMLGDNAYTDGTDAEHQDAVFDMYPTILRQTPLWPTIGNHDATRTGIAAQSDPYFNIFTLPTAAEAGGVPSGTEAYYSFDHGNIHFVCLASHQVDRSTNGAMLTWLNADLSANTNFWTIVFWHHPPYSKGGHNSDIHPGEIEMRENAVPLLETYGVDLVLCGHSHTYERSMLIDGHHGYSWTFTSAMIKDGGDGREDGTGSYQKGRSANEGAVYAVAGTSGSLQNGPLNHPVMVTNLRVLGSMILDIVGARLDARFIDNAGEVRDSFTILKADPSLTLVASDASASETGSDSGVFTITRTGSTNQSLSVNYTVTGTASNGLDYAALSGSVLIPAGTTSVPIVVAPVDDTVAEGSESVEITLASGPGYTIEFPSSGSVTIDDNEQPPVPVKIMVSDDSASESGLATASFRVRREGSTTEPLQVFYQLGGTATYGADYTVSPAPGSVTILPGKVTKLIRVNPIHDLDRESTETIVFTLLPGPGYQVIPPSAGTATISSDE